MGVIAAALVVVALVVAGSRLIGGGTTASPSASPDTASLTTPAGSMASGAPSSSPAVSAGLASATTSSPSPAPIPTQTAPTAEITFENLVVDSSIDPDRTTRMFTFTSDGPGAVAAQIVGSSPVDSTTLCLSMDETPATCATGGTPGIQSVTGKDHARWTATLISAGESSPTVDVTFRWPSGSPSISLIHGRFQGSPNRDSLRTLSAAFKPRAAGRATFEASWAPSILNATLTLTDMSKANEATIGRVNFSNQTSTVPAYSAPVSSERTYRLKLLNESKDGLRPDLDATITFP
jgi:hypothetical protein